jgi:hypothetical protein
MSAFADQDLFRSGPHRFHVGGLALRHALQQSPAGEGVQLCAQGHAGRAITQTGDLVADDPVALQTLVSAIEALLDGQAHDLVDDLGRLWPDTVMLAFEPDAPRRLGPRWAVAYRIQYVQLTPCAT